MKNSYNSFLSFLLLFFCVAVAQSQHLVLRQSTPSGIYKKGELIKIQLSPENVESDSVMVKILKNYQPFKTISLKAVADTLVVFDEFAAEPVSMQFQVIAGNKEVSTGLVVDPEKFQPGTPRPKDFAKYWKAEKKQLRALPMEVTNSEVGAESGYLVYASEINCTGPKPARGYFAKPENAAKKSLPIVIIVRAAGVKGEWCQSKSDEALRYAKMGKGALAFDLNAHGMLVGQPQRYYDELEAGELNGYYFSGLENREEFYFRGMYLRLQRTIDFLTRQPEWDGKRIIVIGESQGGGQALVAAGLDKRVSAAVATVPAMCDWGGSLVGNRGGWPDPFKQKGDQKKMMKTLPYFDTAHLLKNSKATLVTEIGFIDFTCSSNSIYAAINQSKGKKVVFAVPYRGHHVDQKQFQKPWEETVFQPKMKFIADFLK